jgi:hypothetical protein
MTTSSNEKTRSRLNAPLLAETPSVTYSRDDSSRQRNSRSSSAELTPEPLTFVPQRHRNAVSRREDETDSWGNEELDSKEEYRVVLRDLSLRVGFYQHIKLDLF